MLSSEEVQVYHIASEIVNEAVSRGSVLNAELFIHDAICRATSYFTDEMFDVPRFCTAVGVFVDGQSNCQGYADAFQMLAKMLSKHMDIQVTKLRGDAGGGHVWNLVSFDSGNIWYSVDVCWDDLDNESDSSILSLYKYFNVSADLLAKTHSWTDTRYFINPSLDDKFYYRVEKGDTEFGLRFPSAVNAVVYMADEVIQRGTKKLFLSVPHDAELDTYEEVCEFFNECFTHYNEANTFWYYMYVENLGERSFFGLEIVEGG